MSRFRIQHSCPVSLCGFPLTAPESWVIRKNRLTLDLRGGLAVLEDGSLPGDVEETALVGLEGGVVLGELT